MTFFAVEVLDASIPRTCFGRERIRQEQLVGPFDDMRQLGGAYGGTPPFRHFEELNGQTGEPVEYWTTSESLSLKPNWFAIDKLFELCGGQPASSKHGEVRVLRFERESSIGADVYAIRLVCAGALEHQPTRSWGENLVNVVLDWHAFGPPGVAQRHSDRAKHYDKVFGEFSWIHFGGECGPQIYNTLLRGLRFRTPESFTLLRGIRSYEPHIILP